MMIRVATISSPGLHELQYDKSGKSVIGGSGFFLEPLNILAKKLNFTLNFIPSHDGQWGALNRDGTWNGMIGMLINDKTDIAGAQLTVTEARGKVVSFGRTIDETVLTLTSAPSVYSEANPWVYVEALPQTAWCVCCVMVIGMSSCFVMINNFGISYLHDKLDSEKFTFLNGIALSLTLFRLIYYNINLNSNSTRLLFAMSALSTYLLFMHYTAYLTAASTYSQETNIQSFEDVLSGGYRVTVWENTSYHDILRYSKPTTAMNEVYHRTMKNRPDAYIKSFADIQKVLAKTKTLYYTDDMYAMFEGLKILNIQVCKMKLSYLIS